MAHSQSFPGRTLASSLWYLFNEFDSLRLVAPASDPQYAAWFMERSRNLDSYNQLSHLLGPSAVLCLLFCLARTLFVRWALRTGQHRCGGKGVSTAASAEKQAPGAEGGAAPELRWAEGCWTMTGGSVLLLWSWLCVVTSNGGCPRWPSLDTSACLAGWPLLPLPPLVRSYYCAELAWYTHLLAKHHLGVGLHDSRVMTVHHLASLYLLVMSYCFTLHRPGVLLLALLNASTPLLHLSKTAHHTGNKRLALSAFAAFAAVFFASRVVLFPIIFLPLGLFHSQTFIPRVLKDYPLMFAIVNGLLIVLVAMQWVWFGAILRVMRQAASGDSARLAASAQCLEQQQQDCADTSEEEPLTSACTELQRGTCVEGTGTAASAGGTFLPYHGQAATVPAAAAPIAAVRGTGTSRLVQAARRLAPAGTECGGGSGGSGGAGCRAGAALDSSRRNSDHSGEGPHEMEGEGAMKRPGDSRARMLEGREGAAGPGSGSDPWVGRTEAAGGVARGRNGGDVFDDVGGIGTETMAAAWDGCLCVGPGTQLLTIPQGRQGPQQYARQGIQQRTPWGGACAPPGGAVGASAGGLGKG